MQIELAASLSKRHTNVSELYFPIWSASPKARRTLDSGTSFLIKTASLG